jgi:Outer membrane protein beta-barrel domain
MKTAHWLAWAILGSAPLASAAQVVAEEGDLLRHTYFGFNVGRADYKFRNPPPGASGFCGTPGTSNCQKHPAGWKLTAGYMILPYIGVEGAGFSMGDAHVNTDLGGGVALEQKVRIQGFALSAVGALPLGPVTLNARAGYAAATAVRRDDIGGGSVGRSEKTRAEPIFGAGVGVRVWQGLFVRLDWDRARARTILGEKFQADLISAGVGWQF